MTRGLRTSSDGRAALAAGATCGWAACGRAACHLPPSKPPCRRFQAVLQTPGSGSSSSSTHPPAPAGGQATLRVVENNDFKQVGGVGGWVATACFLFLMKMQLLLCSVVWRGVV